MRFAHLGSRGPLWKRTTALALGALALAACTTGNNSGGGGTADSGKVTLTFLSHYGDEPMKSGISNLISQWNQQNPNIQVKQQTVPFDDLLTTLNVRQTGGQGADILSSYALWGGQLAANGVLDKPPADVASDITSNYSKSAANAVTGGDGQVFGYPTEFATYVLYYNKKILADAGITAPPTTWQELQADAQKTTKKDANGNYQVEGLALIQDGDNKTAHPFLALLNSAGGKFLNPDGTSAMDDKAKAVMQLESDLTKSGASTTAIAPTQVFPSNHVAMAIQASWWIGSLKTSMKDAYSNVGTAPVPGPQAGQKGSLAYAFFLGVNSGSRHKTEAWKFLTWLDTHKVADGSTGMGAFLADQGLIPPRKSDLDQLGAKFLAQDPNLKPIYDAASFAMSESNASNAYKAKTSLHTRLNELMVKGASVDDTFTSLVTEINKK